VQVKYVNYAHIETQYSFLIDVENPNTATIYNEINKKTNHLDGVRIINITKL
jgi:hypothetical protein